MTRPYDKTPAQMDARRDAGSLAAQMDARRDAGSPAAQMDARRDAGSLVPPGRAPFTRGAAQRATLGALVLGCVALLAASGTASAAEPEPTDGDGTAEATEPAAAPRADLDTLVRVIQQRPILKSGRFELLAGAGLVVNDDMYDHWLATTTGRVHVSEWISIGATYAKYFSKDSDLQREIASEYEVYPELSAIRWYAGGDVTFVAFEGKFVFFDSAIAYWDLYASIGGGVTVTSRSEDLKPTGMVGAGIRLYLTDWLTLAFELKDHVFVEKFAAGSSLVNNVVGQAGLTIFIPFGFDYEYEK